MSGAISLLGLDCELVGLDAVVESGGNILGAVEYSDRAVAPSAAAGYPTMSMAMTESRAGGFVEVWRGAGEVVSGQRDGLAYAYDGEYLFCCGQTGDAADYLEPTERAYVAALDLMRELRYPQLVRMWNTVDGINEPASAGGCRYRRFCMGRGVAFERHAVDTTRMPAATAVGSHAGGVSFYFLAGRSARLTHIENPRQTPAYRYPRRYGLTPPSFARATHLAGGPNQPDRLFISGTASILGSETVHLGDLDGQCVTTLENIAALVAGPNLARHGLRGALGLHDIDQVKVYVKPGQDIATVRRRCDAAFAGGAEVRYADVDICRDDLLVEIEGVARIPLTR